MTTVLVTGADGFIGRNLVEAIKRLSDVRLLRFEISDAPNVLSDGLDMADIVFHLAGVNRPEKEDDFVLGNAGLTSSIVAQLSQREAKPTLVFSSSIQAGLDNPYGQSKLEAELAVEKYGNAGGSSVIFRLPNVFGKWSRPNYNSAVATFCHNIARHQEITITDPKRVVELVYIDDVTKAFVALLNDGCCAGTRRPEVDPVTRITLAALAQELYQMRDIRTSLLLPDMNDRFRRCLYATYLSFLPPEGFDYQLLKRQDHRGSLAELLKSPHFGQIFISRTKPGIVRGNHLHDTKVEKFCVVEGVAIIRFRHIEGNDVLTYPVTGDEFRVVDIPPGYTHSIENIGTSDSIVLFWSSEVFDSITPDTYPLSVLDK